MGLVRDGFGSLRRATKTPRDWLRTLGAHKIQRSVQLQPEDYEPKRRRWHVLVDLVNEHCPDRGVVVAEIGTDHGPSSAHLVKYCPQIAKIYAVDLRKPDADRDFISHLAKVEFIQGYSDASAALIEDKSLDLIFIDADHSEEWVLRDLEAWVPKVKPGGVIAGHDYGSHNHPGVKSAVDMFFTRHPHPVSLDANKVWWTLATGRAQRAAPAGGRP